MQEEAAYNKESKTVHMQIASGYAKYDAQKDDNLDQTRSRADEMMYENKKMLKAALAYMAAGAQYDLSGQPYDKNN